MSISRPSPSPTPLRVGAPALAPALDPFKSCDLTTTTVAALRAQNGDSDLLFKSAERLRGKGVMHPKVKDLNEHFLSK